MKFTLNQIINRKNPGKEVILFSIVFALIIPLLSFSNCWAEERIGPKMVVEEKLFDAGEVKDGTTIEHTFKIRNTGDTLLILEKVVPG